MDLANEETGRKDRYHLYPNGDHTVYQKGQMMRYPGQNTYANENLHLVHLSSYGSIAIPHGYQGAEQDHGLPHPAAGAEEEGYEEEEPQEEGYKHEGAAAEGSEEGGYEHEGAAAAADEEYPEGAEREESYPEEEA